MTGLTTINYTGTKAEWTAITGLAAASIKSGVTVVCTDGNITIS